MKKHAFLIMAHGHWELLKKLLILIDHPRVDVYLHIDKKCRVPEPHPCRGVLRHAALFEIPRRRVFWGDESQILCELDLIRAALPGEYQHYHLLSGVDLPLKPIEEILAFFDRYPDREFVHFDAPALEEAFFDRFRFYYPFSKIAPRSALAAKIRFHAVKWQKKLGVCRHKTVGGPFGKGANWFSCTHAFLTELMRKEKKIRRFYAHTFCCDEVFLQSFLLSTPFREKLYDASFSDSPLSNMRLIDWKRGSPYTFRGEDVPDLLSSPCLFARKFDEIAYPEAVDGIFSALCPPVDQEKPK